LSLILAWLFLSVSSAQYVSVVEINAHVSMWQLLTAGGQLYQLVNAHGRRYLVLLIPPRFVTGMEGACLLAGFARFQQIHSTSVGTRHLATFAMKQESGHFKSIKKTDHTCEYE
jgi:hypothetical protein